MSRFVTKIAMNGNALMVCVPRSILGEMRLVKGDHVCVTRIGGAILVMPIEAALDRRIEETTTDAPALLREAMTR